MNYIHICDNAGKVIVSRLGPDCRDVCLGLTLAQCERCESHSGSGKRRRGKITVPAGSVFLCADDDDMVKSKRVFMKSLDLYAEMVSGLIEIQKLTLDEVRNENRRLVHNLTTLNSHIIQEIYNIVPQDDLAGGPSRQISVIADALSAKPVPAAQAALRILKNAVAARTEMQIVRRFQSAPQLPPQQRPHSIHKVIKNVLITFFQDSQDQQMYWNLRKSDERVLIDYESVSAAFYRLFENFIKYCAPTSSIDIAFENDGKVLLVVMEMKSLQILPGEEKRIFDEGYSGAQARKYNLNGIGLGLLVVRQMLETNHAEISVQAGTRIEVIREVEYVPNRFVIRFLRST